MTHRVVITAAVGLWAVALSRGVARPAGAFGAAAALRSGATHAVVVASAPLSRYAAFVGSPEKLGKNHREGGQTTGPGRPTHHTPPPPPHLRRRRGGRPRAGSRSSRARRRRIAAARSITRSTAAPASASNPASTGTRIGRRTKTATWCLRWKTR